MQIAQFLPQPVRHFFSATTFDVEKQSAALPIRHMKFDFKAEEIDPKF